MALPKNQLLCGTQAAFKAIGMENPVDAGAAARTGKSCVAYGQIAGVTYNHPIYQHKLNVCREPDGKRQDTGDFYGIFITGEYYNPDTEKRVDITEIANFKKLEC